MTTAPNWSPTDDDTTDLLSLVADVDHPSVDREWSHYQDSLCVAADSSGRINPNCLRELLRDDVAPRRIGAFTQRALKLGLIRYSGEWVTSTDTVGRNAGRPCRVIELVT